MNESIINKKMHTKRIKKELEFYHKKIYGKNYNINIINYLNKIDLTNYILNDILYVNIEYNKKLIYVLQISEDYPFRPYKIINDNYYVKLVELNNTIKKFNNNILKFFYIVLYNIKPYFLSLSNQQCFCCYTILCENSWSASIKIENLLLEKLEIDFISKYTTYITYKNIQNIYIKLIEKFNINEDILSIIIKFLK